MRMQLVREGQQWLTRQNVLLTVVNIKYDINGPITVMFEMGGVMLELPLDIFNRQVHKLVKDSIALKAPEFKKDLLARGELRYNHGELWIDDDWNYYVILRTLGSNKNRFHLLPFREEYSTNYTDYPTSEDVKLVARLSKQVEHDERKDQVLLKNTVCDVLEVKEHAARIRVSDDPESNVLNVGFGNILSWNETKDEELNQLKEDLLTHLWACNDSQDPGVLKLVHEIESLIVLNRWRMYED